MIRPPGAPTCPACLGITEPTTITVTAEGALRRLHRCIGCGSQSWSGGEHAVSTYWEGYKGIQAFDLYKNPETIAAYHARYAKAYDAMVEALGRAPTRVLDYGGGIGNYAAWLEGKNVATLTMDADEAAVEAAKGRGLHACLPEGASSQAEDGGFDAVTLWDVVEHTNEPVDLLASALKYVAPGGITFLETPDAGFLLRTAVRASHRASRGHLDASAPLYYWEHKVYLTLQGLRTLLARNGFGIVWVDRWTSPRGKMVNIFDRESEGDSQPGLYRAMARAYPIASAAVEFFGGGNKLVVVARRVS
ncbi:Methyltransferase domain-containing protein [Mycolicibacterium rutilum]|uniref:Methyltransferase domain-containing protein n=1 Tax=Mycolicibacterium rutilum TaxID=370526 RepID=A0A1H6IC90_MYCRU|nr:class I SAM-dependent methyltransferase [Mycolicibacterium rutilum]SEH46425.1 Methyltransferase domain-containing protein [Mycolicibacterium rutilum]